MEIQAESARPRNTAAGATSIRIERLMMGIPGNKIASNKKESSRTRVRSRSITKLVSITDTF